MGTTTSDTTFVVSKDGKHIKWMTMSLWKRTFEKAQKLDELIKTLKGNHPVMDDIHEWLEGVQEKWVQSSNTKGE